ncbi:MAG: DUF3782 domain-containing protein [Magnetococcales bacterium]|nr:DUF3782 domain-containing protein [Magnetococcales bacterium]
MTKAVTFDDVWTMFQEMVREDRERRAELDRRFQETDRKFQETRLQFQETRLQFQETDRKIKEVSKQVGALSSRWGEFVEGYVAPACNRIFAERGIPVHRVSIRVLVTSLDGNRQMEIDVMVENTNCVVLVEVKSRLTIEDVRKHLLRLSDYKKNFSNNPAIQVMGAVAGIRMDEQAATFAMEQGLFVMVQSGKNVKLANDAVFKPASF